MSKATAIIGVAIVLTTPSVSLADTPTDSCRDILEKGNQRIESSSSNTFLRQILYSKLASSSYEDAMKKESFGFDVPGYFGGKYTPEQHKVVQRSLEQVNFSDVTASNRTSYYVMGSDPDVVVAWSNCMADQNKGLVAYFRLDDNENAVLHIEYKRPQREDMPLKTRLDRTVRTSVRPYDGEDCLKKGKEIGENGCLVTFKMPSFKDKLNITISSPAGQAHAFLPPRTSFVLRESRYIPQDGEKLTHRVKHSATVNGSQPFKTTFYLPDALLKSNYVFAPDSLKLIDKIRHGDGKCLSSDASTSGSLIDIDSRIDINPKDRPADCEFIWSVNTLHYEEVESEDHARWLDSVRLNSM